jgi:hypothetical protein
MLPAFYAESSSGDVSGSGMCDGEVALALPFGASIAEATRCPNCQITVLLRLLRFAQSVKCDPEVAQGCALESSEANRTRSGQGFLEVGKCLLVSAHFVQQKPQIAMRIARPPPVTHITANRDRLLVQTLGILKLAQFMTQTSEVPQKSTLESVIAKAPRNLQRSFVALASLQWPRLILQQASHGIERGALLYRVAKLTADFEGTFKTRHRPIELSVG